MAQCTKHKRTINTSSPTSRTRNRFLALFVLRLRRRLPLLRGEIRTVAIPETSPRLGRAGGEGSGDVSKLVGERLISCSSLCSSPPLRTFGIGRPEDKGEFGGPPSFCLRRKSRRPDLIRAVRRRLELEGAPLQPQQKVVHLVGLQLGRVGKGDFHLRKLCRGLDALFHGEDVTCGER